MAKGATFRWHRDQEARFGRNFDAAQQQLDIEVLKDCEPYIPMDTGNLRDSGIRGTKPGSGKVEWDAIYARRQYYALPNKSRDVHPRATTHWFEAAKAVNLAKWRHMLGKVIGR